MRDLLPKFNCPNMTDNCVGCDFGVRLCSETKTSGVAVNIAVFIFKVNESGGSETF